MGKTTSLDKEINLFDQVNDFSNNLIKRIVEALLFASGNPLSFQKIRDVIGKGGAVIRALTEETNTTIDITDDGTVMIACVSSEGGEQAKKRIDSVLLPKALSS